MKHLIKKIKGSKRVGIVAHISPDEDCLGSMSALSLILNQKGIKTHMFVDTNKQPNDYALFDFDTSFNEDLNVNDFDLLISVDVPAVRMLGKYASAFCNFKNTISIDHHEGRDLNANIIYNEPNSSSCSEVIFKIANKMKVKITPQIASYLFAGIVGDTSCFEHDNVSAKTHLTAMKLYECGADTKRIIFYQKKYQTAADIVLKKLVYTNMVMKDKVAYMIFTNKIMEEAGTDNTKKYVNELLNIEDNIFAFGINQKDKNSYTVSIRCKEGYNACKIAEIYGGGGHIQAAGFSFVGNPIAKAKKIVADCISQINSKL